MKTTLLLSTLVATALILSGCESKKITCSDPLGQSTLQTIISDAAEKDLKQPTQKNGAPLFSTSTIRASLSKLTFSLTDVRTSKEDPNSTKVFCEATLNITVPTDMLSEAKDSFPSLTRYMQVSGSDLDDSLSKQGLEQGNTAANIYSTNIIYNLQPTDDGKSVFAELEAAQLVVNTLNTLVGSALIKPIANVEQAQEAQEEAQALAQEQQRQQDLDAAEGARLKAELNRFKSENKLAHNQLNRIWNNLDEGFQQELLEAQRAWVKNKAATCKQVALQNMGTEQEVEISRLQCDTEWVMSRINEFNY